MRLSILLSVILLLSLFSRVGESADLDDPALGESLPRGVVLLNEANFDANVFPESGPREPWIVVFYSPWCAHCKAMIPNLINASRYFANIPHAKIGLVNAQKGTLVARYRINRYPEVLYTTQRLPDHTVLYSYTNSLSPFSIVEFAIRILSTKNPTSLAEDITEPSRFVQACENSDQASFFFFVPALSSDDDEWVNIVDAAASFTRTRFHLIDESKVPPLGALSESYQTIVRIVRECRKDASAIGPNGLVLISTSDRYPSPRCYSGPWKDEKQSALLHPQLMHFFRLNVHQAVQRFDGHFFSSLSEEGGNYLGVIALDESSDSVENNQVLAAVRQMAQKSNVHSSSVLTSEELTKPRIIWTYVDARSNIEWLKTYYVDTEQLPAFFIVDISRNRFFRPAKLLPSFESVKGIHPWMIDGLQSLMLRNFSVNVLAGKYRGEKFGYIGELAETLSRIPGFETIYRMVGYEDTVFVSSFVAVSALLSGVVFSIWIGAEKGKTQKLAEKKKK